MSFWTCLSSACSERTLSGSGSFLINIQSTRCMLKLQICRWSRRCSCHKSQPILLKVFLLHLFEPDYQLLLLLSSCLYISGSFLCSFPENNASIPSSESLMLCSLSALPTALSHSSSVPLQSTPPIEEASGHICSTKSKQWPVFPVSEQLPPVSIGICVLWHAKTISALSPCGPTQSWAATAGPCVPLFTNCRRSGCVYPPSLSSSVSMVPSSSLHIRQSPGSAARRTSSRACSFYPNWKQEPQAAAPAASKALCLLLPADLVTTLSKLHCKQQDPFPLAH